MMDACARHMGAHKMWKGLAMVVFGVLFFLGTTGVWPEFTFFKYWPLVVIVFGLMKMCPCKQCEGEMMKK